MDTDKNISNDGVPNKRSIRDISMPPRKNTTADIKVSPKKTSMNVKRVMSVPSPVSMPTPPQPASHQDYHFDYDIDRPHKEKKWGLIGLIAVFVLALIYGISSLFASATVLVTPKTQTIPLQGTFSALKDQPAGQFGYQIVSVSSSAQQDVIAGAETQLDVKATGTIIVYNNSQTVQNLIATTRFQTPAGLIFRLVKAVSLPKATIQNKQSIPSNTPVTVIADQSGEKYNIGASDFTLPGLKGSTQFTNIYGRSKVAFTGGFSGMSKKVDAATLTGAKTALDAKLTSDLHDQIASQIPHDFILYPQSVSYALGQPTQKSTDTAGSATVVEEGTASAVIFDRTLLSKAILASVANTLTSQSDAEIKNVDTLTFALTQPTVLTKDYTGQITFTLAGDANIVWLFDGVALKSDVLGLKKSNLGPLLQAKYPTISSATAKIFPIWGQSFPTNPNKITISQVGQ